MKPSLGVRQKIFGGAKKKRATLTGDSATPKKAKIEPEEGESEAPMANEQHPSDADASSVTKEVEDDDDEDLFGDADEDDTDEKGVAVATSSGETAAATTKKEEPGTASKSEAAVAEVKKETETPAPAPAPASATPVASGVPGFTSTTAPVPRKQSTPTSSSSPATSAVDNNSNPGAKYGLPPGVKIPASVLKKNLLHGKALDALKKIPVELMNESLTEYDDAVQIKGESIRNHGAYLYGVIKRYVDVQESRGGSMMQTSLTFAVHKRLEKLVRSGYCTQLEMDEKVCVPWFDLNF